MTVSQIRPHSNYANIDDCIVAAFMQALDLKKAVKADHSLDCVFPGAAYEGMMEAVADEGINTDEGAALAVATAISRIEELMERGRERDVAFDVWDLMQLEKIRLILRNLWSHIPRPAVIAPIAEHFELAMPRSTNKSR